MYQKTGNYCFLKKSSIFEKNRHSRNKTEIKLNSEDEFNSRFDLFEEVSALQEISKKILYIKHRDNCMKNTENNLEKQEDLTCITGASNWGEIWAKSIWKKMNV